MPAGGGPALASRTQTSRRAWLVPITASAVWGRHGADRRDSSVPARPPAAAPAHGRPARCAARSARDRDRAGRPRRGPLRVYPAARPAAAELTGRELQIAADGARARRGVSDHWWPCAGIKEWMAGFGMIGGPNRGEAVEVASGHRQPVRCSAPARGPRVRVRIPGSGGRRGPGGDPRPKAAVLAC
jgi:hypothetical protein